MIAIIREVRVVAGLRRNQTAHRLGGVTVSTEDQALVGIGQAPEGEIKEFVRHGLKDELISLLTMFKAFPSFA